MVLKHHKEKLNHRGDRPLRKCEMSALRARPDTSNRAPVSVSDPKQAIWLINGRTGAKLLLVDHLAVARAVEILEPRLL